MLVGDRAYRVLVTDFIFNECEFVTLVSQLKKKKEERLVLCMVTLGGYMDFREWNKARHASAQL